MVPDLSVDEELSVDADPAPGWANIKELSKRPWPKVPSPQQPQSPHQDNNQLIREAKRHFTTATVTTTTMLIPHAVHSACYHQMRNRGWS